MEDGNRDEENNNEANGGSWWGSWPTWIQTAKEKSSTALEFMKRDLTEFTHVVQTDAVAAVSSTAALIKDKLNADTAEAVADRARQSFSSVLETLTDVFAPQKELEGGELMIIKDSEPILMDWWQNEVLWTQLFRIRTDPKTFCHEPEGPPEMYENWLESFDPSEFKEEMTEIIMSCSETRALYDKLVPTSVSHLEFWQRYFYRVHLLRKAEAKRADLMRRAEQISIEDVEWDKDEECQLPQKMKSGDQPSLILQNSADKENRNSDMAAKQFSHDTRAESKTNESNFTKTENCKDNLEAIKKDELVIPNVDDEKTCNSSSNLISETSSMQMDLLSTDESRSSPVDSLGKDSSTGDDWEKDFDLEINENDVKNLNLTRQDLHKKDEDDWEKWQ